MCVFQHGVGGFQLGGLGYFVRVIQFHQNDIFVGVTLKLRRVEHFLFELDAPAAPVRAGEIQEHDFVFRLGLRFGLGQVGEPDGFRRVHLS